MGSTPPYRGAMPSHLPAGHGVLTLTVDGLLTSAGIRARVDGQQIELSVPTTELALPEGRHCLEVESLRGLVTPYGETTLEVDVPAGGRVNTYYARPWSIASKGRLGLTPQSRSTAPDWSNIAWGLGGAVALFLLICIGAAVVGVVQVALGG